MKKTTLTLLISLFTASTLFPPSPLPMARVAGLIPSGSRIADRITAVTLTVMTIVTIAVTVARRSAIILPGTGMTSVVDTRPRNASVETIIAWMTGAIAGCMNRPTARTGPMLMATTC